MNSNIKKITAAVMCCVLLAGCQSNGTSSESTSSAAESVASGTEAATTAVTTTSAETTSATEAPVEEIAPAEAPVNTVTVESWRNSETRASSANISRPTECASGAMSC